MILKSNALSSILISIVIIMKISTSQASIIDANYICELKYFGQMSESGFLEETRLSQALIASKLELTFESSSGVLTVHGNRWHMEIIQYGSSENSLVAIRQYEGLASSGVNVFIIETWKEGMPFLYQSGSDIYTGRCKN